MITIYIIARPKPKGVKRLDKALMEAEDVLEKYGLNVLKTEVEET